MLIVRTLFVAALIVTAALAPAQTATQPAPQPSIAAKIAAGKDLLDINTATAAQLKALPGIGDAYVVRIVNGRPYTAKNQLATRGVLPQSAYDQIKDRIIAHRPSK